jgi:alpha-1,3-rhamnosyl/mannosyltransferase
MNEPLRFVPMLRPMVWGGRQLKDVLGKPLPTDELYGESWEISDHASHASVVANGPLSGKTLRQVMEQDRAAILGPGADQYRVFPWLVKFLDARDWLSVQVHPDDRLVQRLWPGERGKTEAWFVVDARPGSRVYAGLLPGVDESRLRAALTAGAVADCLHQFAPQPGDCVFLPAGTAHAVGGGVLMAEVQQTSDATFRLFDWNRRDASGKTRALHVEEAMACIDWHRGPVQPIHVEGYSTTADQPVPKGRERRTLVVCAYFKLEYVQATEPFACGGEGRMQVLIVLGGEGRLTTESGTDELKLGDVCLLPASMPARWCRPGRCLRVLLCSMRVVVNLLAATGRKTGIGHYAMQLVRGLRAQAICERIEDYPPIWMRGLRRPCDWLLAHRRPGNAAVARAHQTATVTSHGETGRARLRHWGRTVVRWHFRTRFTRKNCDLYHEPNYIPLPSDLPTIATLHDLSVLLYPEWHPADRVAHFERHFRTGLERCEHFLTDSEFTRQEVIQALGLAPERVTRAHIGVRAGLKPMLDSDTAEALRILGLPPRYLLYFGTIEPRKNVLMLLRAYSSLPASMRERWPLLLVGGWGWKTEAIAEYYHTLARHRNVHHVGYVPDEHAAAIYNGARALVYPSLYEGFGLPPVEMMACGGAVVASTAGPIVETVGGQAHLIPAEDIDGWRDALRRVAEDDDWWMSLRRGAVEKARPYTWDRCAAETLKVYRKVCGLREEAATSEKWALRAAG